MLRPFLEQPFTEQPFMGGMLLLTLRALNRYATQAFLFIQPSSDGKAPTETPN